jgi:hypothetical protein
MWRNEMSLITQTNFNDSEKPTFREFSPGDDFYAALIQAHEGLTDEQSHELNAKLVLIFSNQIGDLSLLKEALSIGRQSVLSKA